MTHRHGLKVPADDEVLIPHRRNFRVQQVGGRGSDLVVRVQLPRSLCVSDQFNAGFKQPRSQWQGAAPLDAVGVDLEEVRALALLAGVESLCCRYT
ncbi:MAG TPA: hypothetical protein VK968_10130 [Roseimicrobium sp.]|nr:hypothetical protein [Roseimicrobium sp.]